MMKNYGTTMQSGERSREGIEMKMPLEVNIDENGCWIANRKLVGGRVRSWSLKDFLYRLTYEALRGPIPEGHVLDHVVCNNPACNNPWHVEPKTQSVHMKELHAKRTHCINGHPNIPENRYYRKDRANESECLICKRERRRPGQKRWVQLTFS